MGGERCACAVLGRRYLPPALWRVLVSACGTEQGTLKAVLCTPRAWSSEQGGRLLVTRVLFLLRLCRLVFGPGQVSQAPREAVPNLLVSLHRDGVRIRGGSSIYHCHKLCDTSFIHRERDRAPLGWGLVSLSLSGTLEKNKTYSLIRVVRLLCHE